ncbi:MAG: DUF72 domain-containing protein [Bacteroidota bacterium]
MKFGKLYDLEQADFSFPAVHKETERLFSGLPQQKSIETTCEILIGCPAWSSKDWIGKIYPAGAKSKDFLKYYGKSFDTIELNTTYYRTPDLATIERWKSMVPKSFRFCPKISQQISHYRRLKNVKQLTEDFCEAFVHLEELLGVFFLQLPPNFSTSETHKLEEFIHLFPKGYQLAVEFRHESWFAQSSFFDRVCMLLEEKNMLTCITDVAGRRDVLHQRLTTNEMMLRFVGNDLHPTDFKRIDDWVKQIYRLAKAGLEKVYFFIHEPDDIDCPELGNYLAKKFKELTGIKVKPLQYKIGGIQSSLF